MDKYTHYSNNLLSMPGSYFFDENDWAAAIPVMEA
jgi:hypothetical protein